MRYGLELVSDPNRSLLFSIEDAQAHQRLPSDSDPLEITSIIKAATIIVERHIEMALVNQTYRLTLEAFPTMYDPVMTAGEAIAFPTRFGSSVTMKRLPLRIEFPIGNVTSIESIKYYDTDDEEVTMPEEDYVLAMGITPQYVVSKEVGSEWPAISSIIPNAVKIEFVAGFGDNPEKVPDDLRHAVKMVFGHLWENREDVAPTPGGLAPVVLPRNSDWILSRYRWR